MKLIEALNLVRRPVAEDAPELNIFLACGFTPLHLQTFLTAELRLILPEDRVRIGTGVFGDVVGSIERLDLDGVDCLAVVIEWGDLDPRLAVRALGGWRPSGMADIVESASRKAARLQQALIHASEKVPTVVCMPTLPLPPMFSVSLQQASPFELQLRNLVALVAEALSQQPGIRIASAQRLDEVSAACGRYDVKEDLASGFPYTLSHASAMGAALASLIHPEPPRKGLITDLDNTLWAGILGEDGVDGISWDLDNGSHIHGLYQQFVASLAGAGVLVAVASKNDSELVARAFERGDLLISSDDIFPFETHWSRKSESVRRILNAWNVGAESVVFIDDSPMEVAEVKAAFPEMECVIFPGDSQGVWNVLKDLRKSFGKPFLTEDDKLRLNSLREAGAWRDEVEASGSPSDEFLKTADAHVLFEAAKGTGDARSYELLNKTNQFNLNGKRLSESEWRHFFDDPDAFAIAVSYKDKFGSLGKVAVLMGKKRNTDLLVSHWVMSCRAFSRRIEHQCLRHLFETFGVAEIVFDYQATPRNGPLQEFFTSLLGVEPIAGMQVSREQFAAGTPALFHRIEGVVHA